MSPPSGVYTRVTRMGVWKCSFSAHLWKIYVKCCLPGTMLGAKDIVINRVNIILGLRNSCDGNSWSQLAWHCTSKRQMATKTPTKPSPTDVPGEATPERGFHLLGKVTIPKQIAFNAKSIPTMTYWHLEQMVTLSENLLSKLGEGVHETLEIPAKPLGCKLWSDSELTR